MREQHIVPLSRQAVEILQELEPLTNREIPAKPDAPRYVFPGAQSRLRPMSENAILAALRRMGYPKEEMTATGFAAWRRRCCTNKDGIITRSRVVMQFEVENTSQATACATIFKTKYWRANFKLPERILAR